MQTHSKAAARGMGWRWMLWIGAALLLLAPAVAMRFDTGVQWSALDFVVFGAMLATACGVYELVARHGGDWRHRTASGIAIGTGFLTVWANLAVGMIDDAGDPANLIFAGVLGVAFVGALLARLRARGLSRAMLATACAQVLAVPVALAHGEPRAGAFIACFALPWLLASWLFARSADTGHQRG